MSIEVENNLENEILPADELAVSQALAGLKHVEAPANFERRVLSKISEVEPSSRSQFRVPLALAYSLPLLLVLVVAIAFVVNSNFRNGPPTNPEVAVNTSTTNSRDTSQPLAGHDSESASQPPVTAS